MSSVSFSPWTSLRDLLRMAWPGPGSAAAGGLRKVGAPSMVETSGRFSPPRSNSWAEILRTGVPEPEPGKEEPPETVREEVLLGRVWKHD